MPKLFSQKAEASRITTYNVEEITYGDVNRTISGSGNLSAITERTVSATKCGEISDVNFEVGEEVDEGDVIAVIGEEEIISPFDGVILEIYIAEGDNAQPQSEVALLMSIDGFSMGIAVDETEISLIEIGQEVTVNVDALSEDYSGRVTAISYKGSSSGGSVAYQITAEIEYQEGIYPGMSAAAEIVIEDSGEGLLVPTSAVRTSGDENYIYTAPSGAVAGDVYEEGELDLTTLKKVTVTTGMSDGSYQLIESEGLSEGDLIIIVNITSTLDGSDSQSENSFGGGSFPGMS